MSDPRHRRSGVAALGLAASLLMPAAAVAGLCAEGQLEAVHRTEARELETAAFSAGSSCGSDASETCWTGSREYNERVIVCNRSRDIDVIELGPIQDVPILHKPVGRALDERTAADRRFAADLAPRFVSGKYQHRGLFRKWYGYVLERQGGDWVVTVILDFRFPKAEPAKLHIPMYLVERLSTTAGGPPLLGTVCRRASTGAGDDGRITVDGTDRACRVNRDAVLFLATGDELDYLPSMPTSTGLPVTDWLMHYWRGVLERFWTRPDGSFQLQVEIANFAGRSGEVSTADLDRHRSNEVVFEVELHHNEQRWNNMYRPIVLGVKIYKAIYAGLDAATVSHEFGHSLGLDDDYPSKDEPRESRDCYALSGRLDRGTNVTHEQRKYLMCDETASEQAVKSVYLWLVTQRYSVGKTCGDDEDCRRGQFCDQGGIAGSLSIRNNRCVAKRGRGEACSRPGQCSSGLCPALDLKCAACTSDSHCDGGEFCQEGAVLSANTCQPKRRNGEPCTRPGQCVSTLCPALDLKCAACTSDSHCDDGEFCKEGLVLSANECVAKKRNGEGCTGPGQCLSGLCPAPDLKCVECTADGHCDPDEYCDRGWLSIGFNQCAREKTLGEACSRGEQCTSGCCKLHNFKVQCRPKDKCN